MGNDEMKKSNAEYNIWLQSAIGAGARTDELLSYFGSPEELYTAGEREWRLSGIVSPKQFSRLAAASLSAAEEVVSFCAEHSVKILIPGDGAFPESLMTLDTAPLVLFAVGDVTALRDPVPISIVGTREASRYGIEVAQKLSFILAKAGMTVISGGALGIDSEAHAGAMLAAGRTVAVLGCGIMTDYLRENAPLRRAITRHGAVVSEFPPLQAASKWTFPVRNRLISALGLGTVVIEAGEKSGSLITARCALEQGRDVFAVPGDIVRSSFNGTNTLIRDGAKAVFGAGDIIEEYSYRYGKLLDLSWADKPLSSVPYTDYRAGVDVKKRHASSVEAGEPEPACDAEKPAEPLKKAKRPPPDGLSEDALKVYALFNGAPVHTDEITQTSGLPVQNALAALSELEMYELITLTEGKLYTEL